MEITTEPVYIRDSDINIHGNIILQLSMAVNKLWPGEALGAQKFHQVWRVYVRIPRTRAGLIVRGLDLSGSNITVHDDNPVLDNNKHTERVVIKDLPATLSSERIHNFLLGFSQLCIKSRILYAKERIGGEEMSPFINGDRLVYIFPNPTPPLPKESVIGGQPCRIWHKSQQNFCKRCDSHGHRTSDVDVCESFNPDEAVIPFRADSNPLSNFFKCSITLDDRVFQSSEHAFQFTKAMFLKSDNLAESIYSASSPHEAKTIAAQLISHNNMADWLKINVDVMRKILRAKWNCSGRFRQTLMSTSGMTIAEATSDMFWGVGVAPNLALHTKPNKFLGRNQLGRSLMELRDNIQDLNPVSIDDVSFTLSAQSNDSPDPLVAASESGHTLDPQSEAMDLASSTLEDFVSKTMNSKSIPVDSSASPLNPSSDIHNLSGNPHSGSPQPGTSSSSNTPQLSGTPPNGTSQSSDIAPSDTIHLDSDSTSVTSPPNDSPHSLPSQPSNTQQPSGHIKNRHSDAAEKQLDNPTDNDTPTAAENSVTDNVASLPASFSTTHATPPTRVPRKARALKQELRRDISQGSLDSFVVRDSSLKRKPSGDVIVSPTSSHAAKVTRAILEGDVS